MTTSTRRLARKPKRRSVAAPYRGRPRGPRPESLAGSIGRRIVHHRGDRQVAPLAHRAGMSVSTWYFYEAGRARGLSLARLGRIAEALGVAVAALLGLDGRKTA